MNIRSILLATSLLSVLLGTQPAHAADPDPLPLVDLTQASAARQFVPSSDQVTVASTKDPAGIEITVQPGKEGYPGVSLQPKGKSAWDLSDYGHVEVKVTNTGKTGVAFGTRVDNVNDGKHGNTEGGFLKPGASRTVKVIFGYAYGHKPAYKLDPYDVQNILFFTGKNKAPQSFRIELVQAAGTAGEKPPVDPGSVRIVPEDGVLFGPQVKVDEKKQLDAKDGAEASLNDGALRVSFSADKKKRPLVLFKPPEGRWDLRDALEIRVKLRNVGTTAITPRIQIKSQKGDTDTVAADGPLAPGRETELTVSFIPKKPWEGLKGSTKTDWAGEKGTGTRFESDAVSGVKIQADREGSLAVSSITAGVPPAPEMPEWLGKRPPVDGDWVQTFTEEFEGDTIDESKWRIYAANYWDKRSHFSKDNVILGDGVVKFRYEKKTGFHNDDPAGKKTNYATGFLDTYGKWVQRYGYFEARMKLPRASGLWPAFWLMPDRGAKVGPQWKRASTKDGGMEFDVMEFLSGWGPYRYNVAWHWNGYDKGHQQTGTEQIYFEPDKDGFVTAGVLWLPGLSVYYANGKEVARWESPRISNVPSDIMFTHVTGGWANKPLDESKLPDDFVIDYVRVWQRKDLASDVDGPQTGPVSSNE